MELSIHLHVQLVQSLEPRSVRKGGQYAMVRHVLLVDSSLNEECTRAATTLSVGGRLLAAPEASRVIGPDLSRSIARWSLADTKVRLVRGPWVVVDEVTFPKLERMFGDTLSFLDSNPKAPIALAALNVRILAL